MWSVKFKKKLNHLKLMIPDCFFYVARKLIGYAVHLIFTVIGCLIPLALVHYIFWPLSLQGLAWSIASPTSLILILQLIYKKFGKLFGDFYYTGFVAYCMVGAHKIFEKDLKETNYFRITYREYELNIKLYFLSLFFLSQVEFAEIFPTNHKERTPFTVLNCVKSFFTAIIYEGSLHIPFLDALSTRLWFIGFEISTSIWFLQIGGIFINSVCYSFSMFAPGALLGHDGEPYSIKQQSFLIPTVCSDAFVTGKEAETTTLLVSVYGVTAAFAMILHLLYDFIALCRHLVNKIQRSKRNHDDIHIKPYSFIVN